MSQHRIAVIPCDGIGTEVMPEGRRVLDAVSRKFHIDILVAHFVQHPDCFDVLAASNPFGGILSDLDPACTGTIGIAHQGNLNPERKYPSLFEPVRGLAPDIAG